MIMDGLCRDLLKCQNESCTQQPVQEFEFKLKIRVDCHAKLRSAAVRRCGPDADVQSEEVIELFGPTEDPSLADCLMALVLPESMAGCTMLNVKVD